VTPASTRFGSDALGGAVALYSAGSPAAGFSGQLRAAVGNEGILKGALGTAYGWDKGWIRVAGSAERQDQVLDPANRYRTTGAFVGMGRQVGDDTLVTMDYFNSFTGVPIPITTTSTGSAPHPAKDFVTGRQDLNRTEVLSGTVRTQFSAELSGELTLGQVVQSRLEPDYFTNLATDFYSSRRNQVVGNLTWRPSSVGSLRVGLDGSEETAKSPDFSGNGGFFFGSARHMAVLMDGEREIFKNFRMVGSVRTERDRQTVPTGVGGPSVDSSINQTTGKLGVNWILPEGFRAYANAGTGFSNPLLYDTMYNAQNGGEKLNNERSRTLQTGLSYASGPWKASLELTRTLFTSYVFFNLNSYLYQNSSDIRFQSAELKGGYGTATWGLDGFYRNQEARDFQQPADQQLSSDAVLRRPFQTFGAHAYRVLGNVRLEGRWAYVGPRYDYFGSDPVTFNNIDKAFNEHFNDLSLWAVWTVREDLSFTLRGDHLMQPSTNQAQWLARTRDYQNDASQIFGYPAQPPTVTLEARYRF
jgi:outer membrane receptor protein involved in Fe transport